MRCTRGDDQAFFAIVTVPAIAPSGSLLHVRIDARPSGTINHFGLHFLHDLTTEYLLPEGAAYIEESARLVPGTGTANILGGAKLERSGRALRLILPAHVPDGASYTPPSIEFDLRITAAPGSALAIQFTGFQLVANAILIGDVTTRCEPVPNPYVIGTTFVTTARRP